MASASLPCSVRIQNTRFAPAARNRDVSDSPDLLCSSEIAQAWSPLAQSQASPLAEQIPWPYCVILRAVHSNSRNAAMRPATTLVLPTLREWPPMTTSDIRLTSECAGEAPLATAGKLPATNRLLLFCQAR